MSFALLALKILETAENNDGYSGTKWLIEGPLLISECSLTISNAGWIGKRRARRDRRCRRSIGVGIPRYQAFLLRDLGLVLSIFHSIGRNPPINEERNHRLSSSNHRAMRTWTLLRDLFGNRHERRSHRRGRRRRAFP